MQIVKLQITVHMQMCGNLQISNLSAGKSAFLLKTYFSKRIIVNNNTNAHKAMYSSDETADKLLA